ncbi:MAG: hypothetical protein CMI95_02990 [Pelagibacteraceae bacterium]|nr:hypothetical protein [Pelagibacteraceae bacterium]
MNINILNKIKLILPLVIAFNINIPINDLNSLIILIITIFLLMNSEIKEKINSFYYFAFIFIIFLNFIINNIVKIQEAHSIFLFDKDTKILGNFIPNNIYEDIKNDMDEYDWNRYVKATYGTSDAQRVNQTKNTHNSIEKPYSFSADGFLQKNKYSRIITNINFKKRSDYRIGTFNENTFSVPYDQDLKESMPFYVFYEIPSYYKQSKICGDGNIYSYFSNDNYNNEEIFIKKKKNKECINLDKNYKNYYIFAYSINKKDNLEITLSKNNHIKLLFIVKIFLTILLLYFLCFQIYKIRILKNNYLLLISFFATYLIAYINDPDTIFGLRHLASGGDGQIFNHYSNIILESLNNYDFKEAFRGGRDVFYFMPGLRYFLSLLKIIFGETNYGYLFVVSFLPYILYLLIKKITNERIAFISFLSFIFFPIFEKIGFGHFNYVYQSIRIHAESASILFIFLSIYLITISDNHFSKYRIILISLLLGMSIFLRPNFLPTSMILSLFILYKLYINKELYNIILYVIFFFGSYIALLHNIYFGNKLIFFTDVSIHLAANIYQYDDIIDLIFKQIHEWNEIIYFPRLILLMYIIYYGFKYPKNNIIFFLLICTISQHIVLLMTHAGSRYAYLAWILTFITFIKISYDNDLYNKSYNKFKKLININKF